MMVPTDEEDDVFSEQHRSSSKTNGVHQKSPLVGYDDSDEDDEDVLFDQMQLLPKHTTRNLSTQELRSMKIARVLRTGLLCLAFCCLGLCIALPGPTMLDLQERTHSDTESISRLFIGRSMGYLLGSIIGGVMFDRCSNRSCLLAAALIFGAIFNAAAPWSREIMLLISILAAEGFCLGFLDTGGNVVCIQIWGRKSAPYMQALHFFFGLGAFVAPLVSEPFLSPNTTLVLNTTHNTSLGSIPHLPVPMPIHHINKRDLADLLATSTPNGIEHLNLTSLPTVPITSKPKKPTKTSGKFLSKDTGKAAGHNVKKTFVKKVINEQNIVANKEHATTPHPTTPSPSSNSTMASNETSNVTLSVAVTTTAIPTTTTIVTTTAKTTTTPLPTTTVAIATSTGSESEQKDVVNLHKPTITGYNNVSQPLDYWTNLTMAIEDQFINVVYDISHQLTNVQFAYLIVSFFMFITGLGFCADCCHSCCTKQMKFRKPGKLKSQQKQTGTGFNCQLISLLFLFLFFYAGMEVTYGGLIFTFVVDHVHWSKAEASYVNSVFWGCFALTRGLSIIISKFIKPSTMIICNLAVTTGALLLLLLSVDQYAITLWIGTALLGIGMASIFPAGLSWAEMYIDVTGKVTAAFITASALGAMIIPALTGFLFEKKTPMFLIYVLFASCLVCCVLYILMQNLAFNRGEKYAFFSHIPQHDLLQGDNSEDIELTTVGEDEEGIPRDYGNGKALKRNGLSSNGYHGDTNSSGSFGSNGKHVHFSID